MVNKIKENIVVLGIIVLTIIMILLFQAVGFQSYSRYSTDTLHYEKASVVEVSSEELEYDEELGMYLGSQELEVEMKGRQGDTRTRVFSVSHRVSRSARSILRILADSHEHPVCGALHGSDAPASERAEREDLCGDHRDYPGCIPGARAVHAHVMDAPPERIQLIGG